MFQCKAFSPAKKEICRFAITMMSYLSRLSDICESSHYLLCLMIDCEPAKPTNLKVTNEGGVESKYRCKECDFHYMHKSSLIRDTSRAFIGSIPRSSLDMEPV